VVPTREPVESPGYHADSVGSPLDNLGAFDVPPIVRDNRLEPECSSEVESDILRRAAPWVERENTLEQLCVEVCTAAARFGLVGSADSVLQPLRIKERQASAAGPQRGLDRMEHSDT